MLSSLFSFFLFFYILLLVVLSVPNDIYYIADFLVIPSFFKDLQEAPQTILGWSLTPAPYFFPDMPLYFFLEWLGGGFPSGIFLFAIAQPLVLLFAFLRLVRGMGSKSILHPLASISISFSIVLIFIPNFQPFVQILIPGIHMGVFVLALLALGEFFSISKNQGSYWLLRTWIVLGTLSDPLFLLLFSIPVWITLFFQRQFPNRKSMLVDILVFSVVGFFLYWGATYFFKIEKVSKINPFLSWSIYLKDLQTLFPLHSIRIFIPLCLIANLFLFYQLFHKKQRAFASPIALFYSRFVWLWTFLVFLAPPTLGLYFDQYSLRYMTFVFILPFLNLGWILSFLPQISIRTNIVFFVIGWTILILSIRVLYPKTKSLKHSFQKKMQEIPEFIACIDHHKDSHNLQNGLADYWHSKTITLFSQKGIVANTIDYNHFDFLHLLNNKKRWASKESINFIYTAHLDTNALQEKFGTPDSTIICDKSSILVYKPGHIASKGIR